MEGGLPGAGHEADCDGSIGTVSGWVEHCIFWHVFPLRFLSAEAQRLPEGAPVQHRLTRLTPWLDYLIDLGASGLLTSTSTRITVESKFQSPCTTPSS